MRYIQLRLLDKVRSVHTMSRPAVLVTRPDIDPAAMELLTSKFQLTTWNENSSASRDFLLKNIKNKEGLYCFLSDKIDTELLDCAGPSLKVISTFSVGFDHINLEECKKRGIRVGYTPDVLTEATAELTVGLLLCTSRRLIEASYEAKNGGWKTWAPSWMTGPGLSGSVVGIVGFGRIGQSVAVKLKAFNAAKILYFNRSDKSEEAHKIGAQECTLDELLEKSDFVICCLAFNPSTAKLINGDVFAKMKKTAIFINSSRGGLVDQDALVDALKNNVIRAAGLDVTTPEPLPTDHVLFKLNNCVVLPHIGSAAIETRAAMARLAAENLIAGLKNTKMPAEL